MKKLFFGVLVFLCAKPLLVQAQLTIQPNIQAVGMVQKAQLWNMLVVNSSNQSYNCRLDFVLRDRITGTDVLSANSNWFAVTPGAKQININTLNPIQYNYLTPGFDTRLQGFLPVGNYTACYTLSNAEKTITPVDECVQFDVEPLSPPMLISPLDSSVFASTPHQLSWVPPTPAGMFNRLQYDVLIVPIYTGQKPAEAIQENIPFYVEGNLATNMLNFPSSAPAFDKEQWYAWQIVARDERNYAGKSETWVFKIKDDSLITKTETDVYLLLDGSASGAYAIGGYKLHIKFFSTEAEHRAVFIFSDDEGNRVKTERRKVLKGDNYFDFRVGNGFRAGKTYSVHVTDKSNKTYTLTFSIKQ
jgi:hypothetical protein